MSPSYTKCNSYDSRGNITLRLRHNYTRNNNPGTVKGWQEFEYAQSGWTDKLVSVTEGFTTKNLTYDANGNVLTYGNRSFTWSAGRNLAGVAEGTNSYSYTYDENGIRTSKTVNGVTTYYNARDGVILSQTDGTNTMVFEYDNFGAPIGVVFNGTQYLYITNQQNDVVAITDENGLEIAEYFYDEWGVLDEIYYVDEDDTDPEHILLSETNPLLYRGYYYDYETGYYYLQSRYYDPAISRFINADIPEIALQSKDEVNGLNLFAYCCNDPVNNVDYSGYWNEKVHNGWNSISGYSKTNYKYHERGKVYKKGTLYYGTVYWATLCGFERSNAKALGKNCNDLDKYYSSTKFARALAENAANDLLNQPHKFTKKKLNEYKEWQYYHFNGYAKGERGSFNGKRFTDTRKKFAAQMMAKAKEAWKEGKVDLALKKLGYGLHALQDIEAHGQIGRGLSIPQHIISGPGNPNNKNIADNINYIWANNETTLLTEDVKLTRQRLIATQTVTIDYLNEFVKYIGGKNNI
ncbi:MAG: hypothetical protein IJ927_05720 [Eubacterium sp.]|nr:hypothetical protein [Eubacterium sp.]